MPNQYKNKIIYGNLVLMDITDSTVTAADVIEGEIFYSQSGQRSVGTLTDATQSAHGLMSATDKTKLDNITITNYYTKTEVETIVNNAIASIIDGNDTAY